MKGKMHMKHSTNIWDCLCKSECTGTNLYFLSVEGQSWIALRSCQGKKRVIVHEIVAV